MKTRYKSLSANLTQYGHKFKKGVWYKCKEPLQICLVGWHCSKNIIDAMNYVSAGYIAEVEVKGKSKTQSDKEAWEEIKIIKLYKWTRKDSISLAIFSAELTIKNFEKEYPNDKRPRETIEAAKRVLKNDTKKNRDIAKIAAEGAWSTARSAECAVESAWWSAVCAAESAECAAESAWSAWSARNASKSGKTKKEEKKILDKCHCFVIKKLS